VLDEQTPTRTSFTNDLLTIYNYFGTQSESCAVHKDMGFLTFVPRAHIPGLQILDLEVRNKHKQT